MTATAVLPARAQTSPDLSGLIRTLKEWWAKETEQWSPSEDNRKDDEADLWDNLPCMDSKAVARTSPIFEEYLGTKLDVKLIRKGGYANMDEMLSDIVPKMVTLAKKRSAKGKGK